jgi:aquaporin Z
MNKLLTEFIGTFFLVLTVGLVVASQTPFGPLAIGSILMIMVYMGGHISGGHYNPAVSLAVYMRGKMDQGDMIKYMVTQLIAAIVAALVSAHLVGGHTFAPAPGGEMVPALVAEFLFTFALALVVLNTATADETAGNSYFGLAIGFTVAVGAFSAGNISGGAFNPAVGSGPIIVNALLGDGGFGDIWLYLVGPFAGGAAAAVVFKIQHAD